MHVIQKGEVGSDFWQYDVDTLPGETCNARAGIVRAEKMNNHYLLSSGVCAWNICRNNEEIEDNNPEKVDAKLRDMLRRDVKKFIERSKEYHIISIADDQGILGDLSDLLPQTQLSGSHGTGTGV